MFYKDLISVNNIETLSDYCFFFLLPVLTCSAILHSPLDVRRCWKKQLKIAMDTARVDILCYRIFVSYRLLNRTSRFRELHKFIEDMKAAIETELGPIKDAAAKASRAHVGRLQAASQVQSLCKLAIRKAEELFPSNPTSVSNLNGTHEHLTYL